jgi:16S rRNA (guanine(966)-N(2))-methyltransferase RsmD
MRVIAGEYKGRKLLAPKGIVTRPTADRVKEAIFSMVQEELQDAICLDLFAGTGGLGIEALSRGAALVYFCDNEITSLEALKNNLDVCRVDGRRSVIIKADWKNACKNITNKCNLVFIDAPYDMRVYYSQILKTLGEQGVLCEDAIVVIERDFGAGGYELPSEYRILREKRYGSVGVDLLLYSRTGD